MSSKSKKYPKWIDEWAKGCYQLFAGTVLEGFQPIDFFHFFPLWYDLFIARIAQVARQFRDKGKTLKEAIEYLPPPSNIRALLPKIIPTLSHLPQKNTNDFKEALEFLVRVLYAQCKRDPFALRANIVHTDKELSKIMRKVPWAPANYAVAYDLGKLMLGLGHLVNGLYNDLVTDMGWEVYGPYDVSSKFGKGAVLLIRDYPNMKPVELWRQAKQYKYKKVRIWTVYRNVVCSIKYVGCHTVTKGRPLPEAMIAYGLEVDGQWYMKAADVKRLAQYFLKHSVKQAERVKYMPLQARKEKALWQECYQLARLMEWLGLDWRPTREMRQRIQKPMPKGFYPMGKLMTFPEFNKYFGVEYLKRLYR